MADMKKVYELINKQMYEEKEKQKLNLNENISMY